MLTERGFDMAGKKIREEEAIALTARPSLFSLP
jgi:hypothetical protein